MLSPHITTIMEQNSFTTLSFALIGYSLCVKFDVWLKRPLSFVVCLKRLNTYLVGIFWIAGELNGIC